MFRVGDRVRKINGNDFSNGEKVVTIDSYIEGFYWFKESKSYLEGQYIELAEPLQLEDDIMKETNWEHNIIHDRPDSEHYTDSGIDVWQFADANFDYDELFGFHRINVIKYVTRFGKKNGRNIRDLEKAKAVIEEMIRMEVEGE